MNVLSRAFGPILATATLLSAPGVQAGPQSDPLASGFVAGVAVGALAATALMPPQPVYVYPTTPYWAPEPPPFYAYPPRTSEAWSDDDDDDDDGDACDE